MHCQVLFIGIWLLMVAPCKYVNAFVRIIAYPSHSSRACPIRLCDVNSLESSLLAHILSAHTDSDTLLLTQTPRALIMM